MNKEGKWDKPDDLETVLSNFSVPEVPEEQIKATVKVLEDHIPISNPLLRRPGMFFVLRGAFWELINKPLFFGIAGLLIIITGMIATEAVSSGVSPNIIILSVAPIPFLGALISIFAGREENVVEIEMSCALSIQQLYIARLVVAVLYDVLACVIISLFISQYASQVLYLMLYWLTPLSWVGAGTLFLTGKVRGGMVTTYAVGVWMVFCMAIFLSDSIRLFLENINWISMVTLTIAGIFMFVRQICRVTHRSKISKKLLGEGC